MPRHTVPTTGIGTTPPFSPCLPRALMAF
jgi:hypothetical protein